MSTSPSLPAVAPTPRDIEVLLAHRGRFTEGYTPEDVNRVLGSFESVEFLCVWETFDDLGYGGDSEFVGRPRASSGPWRRMDADAWRVLSETPDLASVLTPAIIETLLDPEPFETQDLESLKGDGFCNVAIEDTDSCPHCGEPSSGGEGWDGYCGTCADLIFAHESGDHDTQADQDCPSC